MLFYKRLASALTAAKGTLASLASSATAGRQGATQTFVDANNRVPTAVNVRFRARLTNAGSVANDRAVYLWLARSFDGTNFEAGPPTVGAADAAYTFTNAPGGNPVGLVLVGALGFVANSESQERVFTVINPGRKGVFIVQNYAGIALSSTEADHVVEWGTSQEEGV